MSQPDLVAQLPVSARDALVELLMADLDASPARGRAVEHAAAVLRAAPGTSVAGAPGSGPEHALATRALLEAGLLAQRPGDAKDPTVLIRVDPAWAPAAFRRLSAYGAALASAPRGGALEIRLAQARRLFTLGLFFEVHEILEPPWQQAVGDDARILQGVIQAAVAWHHGERGNHAGAQRLAAAAIAKLVDAPGSWHRFPLGELRTHLTGYARWLDGGGRGAAPSAPWAPPQS